MLKNTLIIKIPQDFEKLIRFENTECLNKSYNSISKLNKESGVYCFWWLNEKWLPPIDIMAKFQGPKISKDKYENDPSKYIKTNNKSGGFSYYKKYEDNLMNDSVNKGCNSDCRVGYAALL
ncbi:hypothetical protein [Neolewinella antarctica]|uniref:LAGLIDADG homing endonuclease n=1 Tax=Neolewinella antarctica TaxID=442734 RepID=A0ABX0X5N4_9BACT|nr:hypothetical protein [Neolewinella antarctica]NJC24521.1 hypothetical protein [Neolewinella antarctica]